MNQYVKSDAISKIALEIAANRFGEVIEALFIADSLAFLEEIGETLPQREKGLRMEGNELNAQPSQQRETSDGKAALESYQTIAETIGGPSLRLKDNIVQALVVFACMGIGALIGLIGWKGIGALIGGFAGTIGGTLASGLVLMVLGLVRAAKKIK